MTAAPTLFSDSGRLKGEQRQIIERLDALVSAGKLTDFDRTTLFETVIWLAEKREPSCQILAFSAPFAMAARRG